MKTAFTPKLTLSGVVQPVRIGFIPLADCAPLLIAQELDLFRKHGVRVELSCEVGWATIREKLLYGQVDAAHAIAGLALAMRMGLSTPPCRVVAPFVFNLHGNAITLSKDLWSSGVRDAKSLKQRVLSNSQRRFTFGIVSRYSSHFCLLRKWLSAGGIDVEREVRLVALPPTQMAANLAAGLIDGYCVGEPWNSFAVECGAGWIAATSEQLSPGHPEKVLLTTESFIDQHRDECRAIIKALREACVFCDAPENRATVAHTLAESGYFPGNEGVLKKSLVGPLDLGTGKTAEVSHFHIFQRNDANIPTSDRGRWLINEFIEHGLLHSSQRTEANEAIRACWTSSPLDVAQEPTFAAVTKNKNKSKPVHP